MKDNKEMVEEVKKRGRRDFEKSGEFWELSEERVLKRKVGYSI